MAKRIQRQRTAGWRMPSNAVYVGRPTKWGNPYRTGQQFDYCGQPTEIWDIARVLVEYRKLVEAMLFFRPEIISEIRGKDLACWCPLDKQCHADVLLEIANAPTSPTAAEGGERHV